MPALLLVIVTSVGSTIRTMAKVGCVSPPGALRMTFGEPMLMTVTSSITS